MLTGQNCLDDASLRTKFKTSSVFCHKFTPPTPLVQGPWQQLSVTMMIDEMVASTTGVNAKVVEIYFMRPGGQLSVQDHRVITTVGTGYYHKIGLELFSYDDFSGKTDCIEESKPGILNHGAGYQFSICVEQCIQVKEQEVCGCNSLRYAIADDDVRDCGIFDNVLCPFDKGIAAGTPSGFI